jgi:hypothetical protein
MPALNTLLDFSDFGFRAALDFGVRGVAAAFGFRLRGVAVTVEVLVVPVASSLLCIPADRLDARVASDGAWQRARR